MADRPLRVLEVCARYLPDLGGIETHVHEVSRRLALRDDLTITVLATDRTRSRPVRERVQAFDVLRVPAWPTNKDWYLAPGIARVVARGNWDLVHCQGVHTPVPVLAMMAARASRTPYVVTFHTGGHTAEYRNRLRSLQWRVLGPLLGGAEKLVGVSRFEARLFQRLTGLPEERFTVIRNGGALPPVVDGLRMIPGRIVSSGRLEKYKGHHRVIEALPLIRQAVPGATLRILGAGPYEDELRAKAKQLGVGEAVTIDHIPPGDREAMARALGEAQAFAAFSDYEAHPVAVVEALTLGVPVVGYDVAGIADLVEDGIVRGVTPGAPPAAAADALVSVLTCRSRAAPPELPTWDGAAAQLAEVYQAIAKAR